MLSGCAAVRGGRSSTRGVMATGKCMTRPHRLSSDLRRGAVASTLKQSTPVTGHSGDRGKRIRNPKQPWLHRESEVSLGYANPSVREKKIRNV